MVSLSHEEGGRFVDAPCECHLMIEDVAVETRKSGLALKVSFSVLGATDPTQVGKTVSDFFGCEGKVSGQASNLAEAARLVTPQQRAAAKAAGVGLSFDETQLKGRQIGAKVHMERAQVQNPATGEWMDNPNDSRSFAKIGFDTFDLRHPTKAAKIPLDPQFAGMWPALPSQAAGGNPVPAQPTQPTQPLTAAPVQQVAATAPANGAPGAVSMKW